MPSKAPNPKRAALQQYWHETGFTGIYLRAALRTLQFSSAIIFIGIYGSKLHYRSNHADTPITKEVYALVVGLLSVFNQGPALLFDDQARAVYCVGLCHVRLVRCPGGDIWRNVSGC